MSDSTSDVDLDPDMLPDMPRDALPENTLGAEGQIGGAKILLAVPTLGQRPDYLRMTLTSIRNQAEAVDLVVVIPTHATQAREIALEFGATLIDDPGGLSEAINLGIAQATTQHDFVNWLGDDDTLTPGSLRAVVALLRANPDAAAGFGYCQYVDGTDNPVWLSRFGRLAPLILPWGPDLIPQPGMLIRRVAWQAVGGLDTSLKFAMDLDLLLRLKRQGPLVRVPMVVSTFRWHLESLTVSDRTASLDESEAVKRRYYSPAARVVAPVWEHPVRWATRMAANRVGRQRATAGGS